MSAWRAVVQQLGDGPASVAAMAAELGLSPSTCCHACCDAVGLGLVEHCENRGWYRLTTLGAEYLDGRINQVEHRPGGRMWAATWLRALPVGLRIA